MSLRIKKSVVSAAEPNPVVKSDYADAISYIEKAIHALGGSPNIAGDEAAKDAIANLSVILFDLQS